jgi:protein O-GlcNAc transferase
MNIISPPNEKIILLLKYYKDGKIDLAEKLALLISKQFPKHEFSWRVLGAIFQKQDRKKEALNANRKALSLAPNDAEIHNNLGVTLLGLQKLNEAESNFRKALLLKSSYTEAHYNLANTLKRLNRLDEAEMSFYEAIRLNPGFIPAYNNLGNTLKELGRLDEAINILSKAITLKPDYAEAYNSLGGILLLKNLYDKAITMFNQSINIYKKGSNNNELIAASYKNKGLAYLVLNEFSKMRDNILEAIKYYQDIDFAYGLVLFSKLHCADWDKFDYYKNLALKSIKENKKAATPFCSFSITDDPATQLKIANISCKDSNKISYVKENYLKNTKHTKPRVAYLSYDFHDHATMHLMAGIFEHQDNSKFDYYAFSYSDEPTNQSNIYNRVRKSFQNFDLVTEKKDNIICKMLKDKEIDIIVDLKGHTLKTRMSLLANRPCPIQVTFLGHPGTTGTNYIDYAIADNFIVNKENEAFFSEKILKLPNCYQPTDNKRYYPNTTLSKKDLGLPENKFIFCSFNSPYKIQPAIFNIWIDILKSKENSVLWLLADEKSESVKNILEYAQERGVARNRIIYSNRCEMNDYLDRLKVADLFLDTFPVTAHTTASDALWVGLPVLTLAGKSMASRIAGSLLNSINMKELITYNYNDYKNIALKLSNDKIYYNKIKSKLQKNRHTSPLFNTKQYTKDLEEIYSKLFKNFKNSF